MVSLGSVSSSEEDDAAGLGDGNTVNDIQDAEPGSEDFEFRLLAERAATGQGRTYAVSYHASDGSGNLIDGTSLVVVRHDLDGIVEPLAISLQETGAGALLSWTDVPGALFYNVVRGGVTNLRATYAGIALGPLMCVASGTVGTDTRGRVGGPEAEAGLCPLQAA